MVRIRSVEAIVLCQPQSDRHDPEVTTASQLRCHIHTIQPPGDLQKLAILLTDCQHPTPRLITLCCSLSHIITHYHP
ncbi:hypothetical protein NG796_09670 [Laspinema sp. A4]|uniref:hypothetical protein n=1 Tax=Laspinema sp. D2d TaxID=2953686 RepID=UPI0021BAE1E4|nr:hypothetical protein [Laspinema sp. D2d]MCT7983565.1 hypothetical protein [Laspinema sp. D2d]